MARLSDRWVEFCFRVRTTFYSLIADGSVPDDRKLENEMPAKAEGEVDKD